MEIKAREQILDQRILLRVKMGLRALDEQRKKYQKEFIRKAEELIIEVNAFK